MKKYTASILFLLIMCSAMISGCEIVGGIFKAGMWTATIIIVLVVALIIYIISKFSGRNKN